MKRPRYRCPGTGMRAGRMFNVDLGICPACTKRVRTNLDLSVPYHRTVWHRTHAFNLHTGELVELQLNPKES